MVYVSLTAACYGCGRWFMCNPLRVPSVRVKDGVPAEDGQREPICRECLDRFNVRRVAAGLDPIVPAMDAYDAVDESEVVWNDED